MITGGDVELDLEEAMRSRSAVHVLGVGTVVISTDDMRASDDGIPERGLTFNDHEKDPQCGGESDAGLSIRCKENADSATIRSRDRIPVIILLACRTAAFAIESNVSIQH